MNKAAEEKIELLEKQLAEKEYELSKIQKKYEHLYEEAPLGIFKSTFDGKFLEMNDAFAVMLGYASKEEAIESINDISKDIYVDKSLREKKMKELLAADDFLEYDIDFLRKDGAQFTGRVIAKVIRDKESNPKNFFGFVQDVTKRIEEKKELEASRELFYSTFNNSLDSNFIISMKDLCYIEVNQKFLKNTKQDYYDVIGHRSSDFGYFLYEKDIEEFRNLILKEGKIRNKVISINIRNERRWFSINAVRIKWKGEDCAYVSSREITEEKKMHEELLASEKKFRSLVNNANLGIIIIQNMKIKYANPTALQMYGYDKEDQIPENSFEYIHPDDIDFIKKLYERRIAGEDITGDYQVKMLKKDASFMYVNMRVTHINWDGKPALFVFTNDVSENITAKKELKETEEKYIKVFENIHDVYYELTLDGKILFVSPSVKYLNIKDPDNLIGKNITEFYEDPRRRDELLKILRKEGKVTDFEIKLTDMDGKKFFCSISSVILYDEEGIPSKIAGVMRNITVRKKAEQQLMESEKKLQELVRQKDTFFNIIAHDLRSPISGFMDLTEDLCLNYAQLTLNEMRESIEALNRSSSQIYDMLNNLLQWSRSQTGNLEIKKEVFDILKVIDNSIDIFSIKSKNKNIDIINEISGEIFVFADKGMISTVVQNLLSNALKFTDKSGKVQISSKREDDRITIYFKDNGIGIDEEHINTLFKITGQYLQEGTSGETSSGLGLLIAREFIEKNDGTINVISRKGDGSTFYFTLPVSSE